MCMTTDDMMEMTAIAEHRHLMIEALASPRSYREGEEIWKLHSEISWTMSNLYTEDGVDYHEDAAVWLKKAETLIAELKEMLTNEAKA